MNAKLCKKFRKAVKEGFKNLDASYYEVNKHYKSYGLDPVTKEPLTQLVSTIRLEGDCGRYAYQTLKAAHGNNKSSR